MGNESCIQAAEGMMEEEPLDKKQIQLLQLLAEHGPVSAPELAEKLLPGTDGEEYGDGCEAMDRRLCGLLVDELVFHEYRAIRIPIDYWYLTDEGEALVAQLDAAEAAKGPAQPVPAPEAGGDANGPAGTGNELR